MAKTQAIEQSKAQEVQALLKGHHAALAAAMPKHVSADRLARVAINAIAGNKKLQECTALSLLRAITVSGMLGLEPNTPLQHAYLVPFRNTRDGVTEVQLMIGYRGLIDLARRSGDVLTITAHCVYANDEFDYELGMNPLLKHKPILDADRGDFRCVYAIYKGKDGAEDFEVMSKGEVQKIRKNSKSANSPAWAQWPDEMARKSAIRRLCKRIPMSLELATTVQADDRGSGVIGAEGMNTILEIEDVDIPVEAESTAVPTEAKAPEPAKAAAPPAPASEPAAATAPKPAPEPKKKPGRPKKPKAPAQEVAPPTELTAEEKAALAKPPATEEVAPDSEPEPAPEPEVKIADDPPVLEDYVPDAEEEAKLQEAPEWANEVCRNYGVLHDDLQAAMVEWRELKPGQPIRNATMATQQKAGAMPVKVAKLVLRWKEGEIKPKEVEA